MIKAGRNSPNIVDGSWKRNLAVVSRAPTENEAVTHREAVVCARCNGAHVGQSCGNGRLTGVILAPPNDLAVSSQGQAVVTTCGDSRRIGGAGRNRRREEAPYDHLAVGAQAHAEIAPCRDRNDVCVGKRVSLTE